MYRQARFCLCERCLEQGKATTAREVHHKIKLTRENLNNPEVSLNWENLMLLCDACHEEMHPEHRRPRRYDVDPDGRCRVK